MENHKQFKKWLLESDISKNAYNNLVGYEYNFKSKNNIHNEIKISIAISTYNRACKLNRLLNSVIQQNYNNYEIIIVDDKSTDNTHELVRKFKEKNQKTTINYYINEKNSGVAFSKKRGYMLCTGDIIIFSDDDDYYIDNNYFAKLEEIYKNNPECTMTVASTISHNEVKNTYSITKVNFIEPVENDRFLRGFISEYKKPDSMFTLSINSKKMKEINYTNLKCFNDMSLYLYASLAKGRVYPIQEAVGVYSAQANSMSSGVSAKYIINNLNAKLDIGKKAKEKHYIENKDFDLWIYNQTMPTLMLFFNGKIKNAKEYIEVNKWVLNNLAYPYKYKAIGKGIKRKILSRIKNIKQEN